MYKYFERGNQHCIFGVTWEFVYLKLENAVFKGGLNVHM